MGRLQIKSLTFNIEGIRLTINRIRNQAIWLICPRDVCNSPRLARAITNIPLAD